MQILELFQKKLKLDFSNIIIEVDCGNNVNFNFELKPQDFLRFAKIDIKGDTQKDYINALTNAKRAIDCEIDGALLKFGIKYDRIKEIANSANKIVELVNFENANLSYKLKLIRALDFAPIDLISKYRNLRNKIEHHYQKPKKNKALEAIDIAELFILSIESKTQIIIENLFITDKHNYINNWVYKNFAQLQFDLEKKLFLLTFYVDNLKINSLEFNKNDILFYAFIKLLNNINDEFNFLESFKIFLKLINHPIPEKNIGVIIH